MLYLAILYFLLHSLRKRKERGYKPYRRDQRIKVANHTNIDQN
ncbi:hypothetical protein HMPREF1421_00492 [Helicobacter pylori GAM265BSii]|uniref:Uncharacterized protein n=1 Tax=Helicobacter pylori GAM265BSii TaxID=1159049 RepID=M3QD89_HELPX|nr:hypothetical protein HMPREF1404_00579 [Helicobacter pylori GAM210Bi]EMH29650.1 hypothetical protein HMPREF1421_00492 [Helicobacter pylori GAM265BSii]